MTYFSTINELSNLERQQQILRRVQGLAIPITAFIVSTFAAYYAFNIGELPTFKDFVNIYKIREVDYGFLAAITFIFVFFLSNASLRYVFRVFFPKIIGTGITSLVPANNWKGSGAFYFSAPSQGIDRRYSSEEAFSRDLRNIRAEIYELRDEAIEAKAPAFIANVLEEHAEEINEIAEQIRNREFGAAADFEKRVDESTICHPDSIIGTYVYGAATKYREEGRTLPLRLLAFVMFFKAANEEDKYVALANNENLEAMSAWAPELAASGQTQVLFGLSLNSGRALAEIKREKYEIVALKTELQQALDNARSTLELKPAANRWQRSARNSGLLACVGLAPFLLLLIGVPYALWANWDAVASTTATFLTSNDEQTNTAVTRLTKFFTDAPWATFVFVTVPVLLFAWTLKHFSRIFVQNMNLASDAGRRAALADVYTRIVSDPDLNKDGSSITDEQKKIIFEAMFRPRDARHTDDGIDHTPVEKIIQKVKEEKAE